MKIHKVKSSQNAFWGKKKTIYIVFSLIFIATIALLLATYKVIDHKKMSVIAAEQERLEAYVIQKGTEYDRLIKAYATEGDRLVESDLFRLYATEVDAVDGNLSAFDTSLSGSDEGEEVTDLLEQLPLMENMLREFAVYAGFLSARIFSTNGEAYLATDIHLAPVTETQNTFAMKVVKSGKLTYGPFRKTNLGLELDFFLPIFPPEGGEEAGNVVGVLLMTRQVSGDLTAFLTKTSLSLEGESTHLIQRQNNQIFEVTPWSRMGITEVKEEVANELQGEFSFAQRQNIKNSPSEVFSVGHKTAGDWLVVQEIDVDAVLGPVDDFSQSLYTIAWLGVFAMVLVMSLGWWILSGLQSRKDAEVLAEQARTIEEQKQFISSINESIDDFIVLKDLEGKYLYVNEAFAEATEREKENLIGLDDVAVFGFGTANRLLESDKQVAELKEKIVVGADIFLQSNHYHFQISKMPYLDSNNNCIGVVQVYRDITEVVAMQQKTRQLNQQTILALGATIEAVDPYLAGHTHLLRHFAKSLGTLMEFSDIENEELLMAANLSQIGKAFIPKDILSKPGKLTEDELAAVENHVEHACKILREIDVPEKVLEMIAQMNERLDGSGYPKKLTGDNIGRRARLLSVLNVFCALISPRSYREALDTETALEILDRTPDSFDQEIVSILKKEANKEIPEMS